MGGKYKIITIVVLIAALYWLFTETRYLIPSKKEIADPQGFADLIIFESGNRLSGPDTIFIVTEKSYAICGTGMKSPSKLNMRFVQLADVLREPYYISLEYIKPESIINGSKIFAGIVDTGPEGCNCLAAGQHSFPLSSLKQKALYAVEFEDLSKESAVIHLKRYEQDALIQKFKVIYTNGKWILEQ